MNLESSLQMALTKLVASGEIEVAIDKAVEQTVLKSLKDALGPYSEFGKAVDAAVKQSLTFTASDLGLPEYNALILEVVRAKVAGLTKASIERDVAAQLEQLLQPAPETITISGLVEKFVEYVKERRLHGCTCHEAERVTLHVSDRESDYSDCFWQHIYLDEEADKAEHECGIRIALFHGEILSLNIQRRSVDALFAGPFYGFEKLLVQMKAAKSRIVFDVATDEIDLSYEV